jgi:RNA-binding protein YhbY
MFYRVNIFKEQLQERKVVKVKVLSSAPAKKGASQTAASAKSTNFFAILNVTHQAHAITNRDFEH